MSCGRICTSPPPAVSVSRPFDFSQVRSATSWVLPSCGDATTLPFEVGRAVDRLVDDEVRAARRRARDDLHALVELGPRGDGRARADVAGVERSGLERLERLGAGVERVSSRFTFLPSAFSKMPLLDADDRRRVGDVGEVAEPERDRLALLLGGGRRHGGGEQRRQRRRRRRWRAAWWWCGTCALRESPPGGDERIGWGRASGTTALVEVLPAHLAPLVVHGCGSHRVPSLPRGWLCSNLMNKITFTHGESKSPRQLRKVVRHG